MDLGSNDSQSIIFLYSVCSVCLAWASAILRGHFPLLPFLIFTQYVLLILKYLQINCREKLVKGKKIT